jgi:hypothetical protein
MSVIVPISSALPLTADMQMGMSASLLISSGYPSTADAIVGPDFVRT